MSLMKTLIKHGIYVLFSLIFIAPMSFAYAQTAKEEFSSAQQAFREGDFQKALKGFRHAKAMGIKGPAIIYNLGVVEYKLKHYTQSEQYFSELLNHKGMRPLAAYNLGLVNEQMGKQQQAIKFYRLAYDEGHDDKLKTLAWTALGNLGVQIKRPFKSHIDSIYGLLYGSDSNVIDPINPTSNITDNFAEVYAGMFYHMTPSLDLNGFYLNQNYSIANNYDFQLLNVTMDKGFTTGPWKHKLGILVNSTTLGGKAYESSIGAQYSGMLALTDSHDLRMMYRYEQISAPATMSYLKGSKQRIRFESIDHNNFGNRLMYEMEINSRANTPSFSYSPTRQTIRYYRSYNVSSNWRIGGYLGYRMSDYTPVTGGITRRDQRLRIKASIQRKLGKHWRLVADYSHGSNQSNVAAYKYTRNLYDIGFKAFY